MDKIYDLMVLGAGIAGCEASFIAAASGAEVLLLDMSLDRMNMPPHLPALFVQEKGLEELLARLEGTLFGEALDKSFAGCFRLPVSGEAIILFDRREHSLSSKDILEKEKHIDSRQALVNSLRIEGIITAKTAFEERFYAKSLVFSPGSYIKGRIQEGHMEMRAGRYGDLSSEELAKDLEDKEIELKEWSGYMPGTIDMRTIDRKCWNIAEQLILSGLSGRCARRCKGKKNTVLWREDNESRQLLIPLGPESTEAYLSSGGERICGEGLEGTIMQVRPGIMHKSMILKEGNHDMIDSVIFAGSFAGATGYLECIRDGRRAAELLLQEGLGVPRET